MKIILSRKGFDRSTGGFASPIILDNGNVEEGKLLSLPIPITQTQENNREEGISYNKLRFNGKSLGNIIQQLSNDRFICEHAHLDPDLDRNRYGHQDGWKPVFGQTGGAQTYLENRDVKEGDLFLFFGWFRRTEYKGDRLCYMKPSKEGKDLHVIFGWLQVGEIIEVDKDKIPSWLNYHPHVLNAGKKPYSKNNTIYVAADNLSFNGLSYKKGGGIFSHFKQALQLTAPEENARSHWSLPKWLCGNFIEGKWPYRKGHLPFDSGGRRQEFVFDVSEQNKQKAIKWLRNIFEDH